MNIFDTHFHINPDDDLESINARAKEAGVDLLLVAGTTIRETENLLDRISSYPNIYTAIGVHPHDAENFKKLVPECLGFGALIRCVLPVAGKLDGARADFVPGKCGHEL